MEQLLWGFYVALSVFSALGSKPFFAFWFTIAFGRLPYFPFFFPKYSHFQDRCVFQGPMSSNSTTFLSRCFRIFLSIFSLRKYILAFLLFTSCSVRKKKARKELLLFAKMTRFLNAAKLSFLQRLNDQFVAKCRRHESNDSRTTLDLRSSSDKVFIHFGLLEIHRKNKSFFTIWRCCSCNTSETGDFCFLSAFFAYNNSNVLESLMASSFTNSLKLEINTVSCFFGIWRRFALCTWDETFLLLWFEMSPEIYDFPLPLIVHEAKICTITHTQK